MGGQEGRFPCLLPCTTAYNRGKPPPAETGYLPCHAYSPTIRPPGDARHGAARGRRPDEDSRPLSGATSPLPEAVIGKLPLPRPLSPPPSRPPARHQKRQRHQPAAVNQQQHQAASSSQPSARAPSRPRARSRRSKGKPHAAAAARASRCTTTPRAHPRLCDTSYLRAAGRTAPSSQRTATAALRRRCFGGWVGGGARRGVGRRGAT
eukprot:scaffold1707_cov357-Prasinococcus_capsulatus_cf.AAC.11